MTPPSLLAVLLTLAGQMLMLSFATVHGAILVYEPFDYPTGTILRGQTNGDGFLGPWIGGGFNARAHDLAVVEAGRLEYRGLAVRGTNHVQIQSAPDGNIHGLTRILPQNLGEPNDLPAKYYLSFLHRPDGVEEYSAVVLGSGEPELSIGKSGSVQQYHISQRGGRGRVYSGVEPIVGKVTFLVVKLEFRDGPDRFTLYVNPKPGESEPAKGAVKEDIDLQLADGLTLYSRGSWSVDELRVGTTWADVTPAARAEKEEIR